MFPNSTQRDGIEHSLELAPLSGPLRPALVYYTECKLKNKNGGDLRTRLAWSTRNLILVDSLLKVFLFPLEHVQLVSSQLLVQ